MKWISVEDRLPEDGQNVLCAVYMSNNKWWFGCCQYHGYFPWVNMAKHTDAPIEYWTQLPEPPEKPND